MPSRDSHINQIGIEDGWYLISRGNRWTLRGNLPNSKQFTKALKISSVDGDKETNKAIRKALGIIEEQKERKSRTTSEQV